MKVIPFEEKYRQDFINFNTDWIISNFGFLEEHDKETFEKMDEEMEAGAMIFFAVENDVALATCMAMPMEGETWEICKLGSNKNIVGLMKKDSEIKILIGCTEEEKEIIYKTHNETQYMKGILIER